VTDYAEILTELDIRTMSIMERISLLPSDEQDAILHDMTEAELADARMWLRPSQLAILDDPAPIIVDARGRGAGKTRTGASWTVEKAKRPGTRLHLIGRTVADVRDVMVQGESGVLSISPPDFVPDYMPSVRRLIWPNGSVGMTFSADAPDQLRGPQSDYTWADEAASWKMKPDSSGATAWDNVLISTRLGLRPQILVTTTPRRVRVIRELFKQAKDTPERVSLHSGSTLENRANLSPEYIRNLYLMFAGTALEQQELHGVLLEEVAGAMWRDSDFVYEKPELSYGDMVTVIGVDPGVTTGGDATGIVVCRGSMDRMISDRRAWVVRDETEPGLSPERWAARIVQVWREESERTGKAAIVVAEKNQGGELVSTVIAQTPGGEKIPVALVHAKGSKAARAEPILLAYRRDRVRHEEPLDALEAEMTEWEPGVPGGWSPNHLDAVVHALRAILIDDTALRRYGMLTVAEVEDTPVEQGKHHKHDGDTRAKSSMRSFFRSGRDRI
jgi:phage terminase large subunit-like protein